jgi:uncharacterized protein
MTLPGKLIVALIVSVAVIAATGCASRPAAPPHAHVLSPGFLNHHPDLKHMLQGLDAFDLGNHELAMREFIAAARYASKPSQAMVAEMLWHGIGTPRDRPAAYAWADLAAERHYETFLLQRERYWAELDDAERAAALAAGESLYELYGDAVAKPLLEAVLTKGRRAVTGSRVGFVGNVTILLPGPNGMISVDGSTYFANRYWRPADYFKWQDELWDHPPTGVVEVGPLRQRRPIEATP